VGIVLVTLALLAPAARAHRVNVFAWAEGDTVHVEGYFGGGRKARHATVEVFDSTGKRLLQGKTDDRGEFSFTAPEKTDLKIVLDAGAGHRDDVTLAASDLGEGGGAGTADIQPGSTAVAGDRAPGAACGDEAARRLEALISETLDRKLAPLIGLMRESRGEGPGLTEIVGGIGYIFGLVGVAMYFSNRKRGR
jgi:nickel transport protein